jgi:hypothetical protein
MEHIRILQCSSSIRKNYIDFLKVTSEAIYKVAEVTILSMDTHRQLSRPLKQLQKASYEMYISKHFSRIPRLERIKNVLQ